MNYPNLPNSNLEITNQPEVKEITNELLKQLQNALNSNSLFTEQVELSLKGIVRILEVLLSLDFFKNANEIDSSLKNSIEWLNNAGESLKSKMKEYEGFFSDFNTSMKTNEQEVTSILNANTENIKSEIKKIENQLIETTTRLLTSYQIFLNQARDNANNQITEKQTQAITNINEAKESATTQINTNKTESLEALKEAKTSANNEITAKETQALTNINEAKTNANNEITTNKTESLEALKEAKTSANNEITAKETQALTTINEAKENATTQINTNKQEVLNNITQEKNQATSEINEAKKPIIIKTLIFLRLNKAC
ncbi:hypothetical protein E5P61_05370 [Helicobacter pylori]|nr:hypothetical protein E5P61_05370 [Helicobacter pylori]